EYPLIQRHVRVALSRSRSCDLSLAIEAGKLGLGVLPHQHCRTKLAHGITDLGKGLLRPFQFTLERVALGNHAGILRTSKLPRAGGCCNSVRRDDTPSQLRRVRDNMVSQIGCQRLRVESVNRASTTRMQPRLHRRAIEGATAVYNLASAAAATGVNRSTVLRAIKAGRLSAQRDETGGWQIDPAEL